MAVDLPSPDELREIAETIGLDLDDDEVAAYLRLLAPTVEHYRRLDALPDDLPPVMYPRARGYRPDAAEDPHNAWYYKTSVRGAAEGKLKGKTVVLKDNVMLAGVPMMSGTPILEGYMPEIDATVVTRILDAGGEIAGKAAMDFLSGGSHNNPCGPTHNPHKRGYSAGGSSSGCGVLVALGDADMGIGADQGGSIRVPAAYCGICGLKPTYGLVPYTGIAPVEVVLDHAGPMARTVADNALLLEVIAGEDGYDPRQCGVTTYPYSELLEGGVRGMKIALVPEGFGHHNSESDVDAKVRAAAGRFRDLGAQISEVPIPMHRDMAPIFTPLAVEGLTQTMFWHDGFGMGRSDLYVTSLSDLQRGWRRRANELPVPCKAFMMLGTYMARHHGPHYYGKAVNLTRKLRAAYDVVLAEHDLLLMPTVPMKATPIPAPDCGPEENMDRAFEMTANTAPFNATHHPALSLPCGMSEGLPVGMMLVGRHFDEPTVYRAAHAFEQSADWRSL